MMFGTDRCTSVEAVTRFGQITVAINVVGELITGIVLSSSNTSRRSSIFFNRFLVLVFGLEKFGCFIIVEQVKQGSH